MNCHVRFLPSVREQKKGRRSCCTPRRAAGFVGPCDPRSWFQGTPAERASLYFFGPCGPRPWFLERPPSDRPCTSSALATRGRGSKEPPPSGRPCTSLALAARGRGSWNDRRATVPPCPEVVDVTELR